MSNYIFALLQLCLAGALVVGIRIITTSNGLARADRFDLLGYVHQRCVIAGLEYPRDALPRLIAIAGIVPAIGGFIFSPVMAVVFPIATAATFIVFTYVKERQIKMSVQRINDELCYFIGRSLRAGQSLESSLVSAYEQFDQSRLLAHVVNHINAGSSLAQSVSHHEIQKLSLTTSESMLCATVSLAHNMGGNSARIFERIGDSFHQEYELHHDTVASLSQVKTSAVVISCLPAGMFLFTLMSGGDSALFLFTHPIGWVCLFLGTALQLVGALWMRRLVRKGVGIWTS